MWASSIQRRPVAMAEKLYFDLMLSRQLYFCLCMGVSNTGVEIGPLVKFCIKITISCQINLERVLKRCLKEAVWAKIGTVK